jgi:hypothetical protein
MPDGGDALSGLRWHSSVGLISEAPSGIYGTGHNAKPIAGWRRCLIRPTLAQFRRPDKRSAIRHLWHRAQCQTDCRMAAMPYPAYVGTVP